MSIVQPEQSTIQEFSIEKMTKYTKIIRTVDKKPTKLYIKLNNVEVKFLPQKYDRLVVELPEDAIQFLKDVHNHLNQSYIFESIIKNESQLSIKVDESHKKECNENLKVKDSINVVVCLGDIYTMNKLNYLSVSLYQFKKNIVELKDFL